MSGKTLTLEKAHGLVVQALVKHRTDPANAALVADALVAAEADGQKGHGLSRLPSYCGQAASGKVDGFATPQVQPAAAAALRVDARHGFAYPAMALAVEKLSELTPTSGVAVAAVFNSHHCGLAGYHVEALARRGLVGLLFANTPQAIAPWGGSRGLFGTNPIAFAVPREKHDPMVIDLSLSKVARGKIMFAKQEGQAIPEGWAVDAAGKPTTDPVAALAGTMLPMGDAKGAALVLMVEILAAVLTGSHFGFEATSFFDAEGEPPSVGQLLLAMAPGPVSGGAFASRLETLLAAILDQEGTRLPGDRRLGLREKAQKEGLALTDQQYEQLQRLAADH
ncbi:Ldh family oxidoreductase [Desulfoferula mesophila]|uniref:Sulfolactate dehydrogenase n=1 Tax=Desulfoferula mesophila TaxID=3058419 RepID=A0AAU9EJX0_9BACT|nr:sulfolactate dehydrogenase [Desulfoferula mesophilus]